MGTSQKNKPKINLLNLILKTSKNIKEHTFCSCFSVYLAFKSVFKIYERLIINLGEAKIKHQILGIKFHVKCFNLINKRYV